MPDPHETATGLPDRPRLRPVESFPVSQADGQMVFALRDPQGFSPSIVLPYQAAVLASLMDGSRTTAELQQEFGRKFGSPVSAADVEKMVRELDDRYLLDTPRFRAHWKAELEAFYNARARSAAHAGRAYPADAETLRAEITALFTADRGPGMPAQPSANAVANGQSSTTGRLCGLLCPHVDLHRGGPSIAWAYKRIAEESDADLFVIFGTAHNPMRNLFALTKKDFETPLGTLQTDRRFVAELASRMTAAPGCREINLYADEWTHRHEHSIEFQAIFLQQVLAGARPIKIVPILVGSFHEFIAKQASPRSSPQFSAFVSAVRAVAAGHDGRVCYLSSGDLAHIGQRYGDQKFLDAERLKQQAADDRKLLATLCQPNAEAFFQRIASVEDRHRVCGLSPAYTMLEVAQPSRGELLRYDQAVELDGTSCVSFASAAFFC